jgi:hypothetical protein
MAAFRVVLLVPFNFNIGTIIWQINSERYIFANGNLFTNCTNGMRDWHFVQDLQWLIFPLQLDKMENFSFKFMIKTKHLKFILHNYYFAVCLYSNGKWYKYCTVVINSWNVTLVPLDNIGTIIWQINSERYMFVNGSLFTNCTNGIPWPVADILSIDNLYGTIVNVYINNIFYFENNHAILIPVLF